MSWLFNYLCEQKKDIFLKLDIYRAILDVPL